jgi:glycosyltransferase involved in cell wall biosynthesis
MTAAKAYSYVCVVVPAYNEEAVVEQVIGRLKRNHYEVVVVDDGSTDRTANIAGAAGAIVVRHPINLGQGAALQTGIEFALSRGADILVTFDADGQHSSGEIAKLVHTLDVENADFALGSRFLGTTINAPPVRKIVLRAAAHFTRFTIGIKITDAHNGLRAMTRRGASAIRLRQNRMAHASEILSQIACSELRYVEVPVTIEYSPYALKKGQKLGQLFVILLDLLIGRLRR